MIVVLDTSCISAFIKIGQVDLLLKILAKHQVAITEQVRMELKISRDEKLSNFNHSRISVMPARSEIADQYNIHIGEASVILFAKDNNALAVIDDKKARQIAELQGLDYIGTAALLKLGIETGVIQKNEVENLIREISTTGKMYLSAEIKKWLKKN